MAAESTWWLVSFTPETWGEFLAAGASTFGFPAKQERAASAIAVGDRVVCYLTGASRFVAVYEVTRTLYPSAVRIWSIGEFPHRVDGRPLVRLDLEAAVHSSAVRPQLPTLQARADDNWSFLVRTSPSRWKIEDGEAVYQILKEAEASPTFTPLAQAELQYRPRHDWVEATVPAFGWLDAALLVLSPGETLGVPEIARRVLERGLRSGSRAVVTAEVEKALAEDAASPAPRVEQAGDLYGLLSTPAPPLEASDADDAVGDLGSAELRRALLQHRELVRTALVERLLALDPIEFEHVVRSLLSAVGVEGAEVTTPGGDGGIDVRGTLRSVGVITQPIAVQVKRYRKNVHAPPVQQLRGSLDPGELGLLVTTSDFSKGARDEAALQRRLPISLMNGHQLAELMIEREIGVRREGAVVLQLVPFE